MRMQTKYGFTLMSIEEFENWIAKLNVSRTMRLLQVHHTWSPAYSNFNGNNHFERQKVMKEYHMSKGYVDIAQNLTIFPDGTIMTGRSFNVAPAGIYGANTNGICVENFGNFDKGADKMSQEHKDAIVRVYASMCKKFGLSPETDIVYHAWYTASGTYLGDYNKSKSAKTCPGTNFFGGNTRYAYNKNLKPLIIDAINGNYNNEGVDDEVVKDISIWDGVKGRAVTVKAINKDGENYIRMRSLSDHFDCVVDYDEKSGLPILVTTPLTDININIDGETVPMKSVFRNSTNYLAIRDLLTGILNVPEEYITWDGVTKTIKINLTDVK